MTDSIWNERLESTRNLARNHWRGETLVCKEESDGPWWVALSVGVLGLWNLEGDRSWIIMKAVWYVDGSPGALKMIVIIINNIKAEQCRPPASQARISRGASVSAGTGLPKMSEARGLPLICYLKVVCILVLSVGIILVLKCNWILVKAIVDVE